MYHWSILDIALCCVNHLPQTYVGNLPASSVSSWTAPSSPTEWKGNEFRLKEDKRNRKRGWQVQWAVDPKKIWTKRQIKKCIRYRTLLKIFYTAPTPQTFFNILTVSSVQEIVHNKIKKITQEWNDNYLNVIWKPMLPAMKQLVECFPR